MTAGRRVAGWGGRWISTSSSPGAINAPGHPADGFLEVSMFAILCGCILAASDPTKESGPPVAFEFVKGCGPARGRTEAYNPKTKRYHLLVRDIARFKVKAVAG